MIDKIIFYIHVLIVIACIVVPFLGTPQILSLYSIIVPFLFYHWSVNDDTCFLTQVEVLVTDTPKDKTFMGRLVGPIYNLSDDVVGKLMKTVLFGLWFFVQFKLGRIPLDFEQINNILKKQ
jgi:hypothetical protein